MSEPNVNNKLRAALRALSYVESGMSVGLGTGSTAQFFIGELGKKIVRGELRDIVGVPTSETTARLATLAGIALTELSDVLALDLAVDGADEIDPQLDLIKGLGGALLREKAVEKKARTFIVIADDSKLVRRLGEKTPVPVEVAPAHWLALIEFLRQQGCVPQLRGGEDHPFVTDNGNFILDCYFKNTIPSAAIFAQILDQREDVRAHGLFLDMAQLAIVATAEDEKVLRRP